MQQRKYEGKGMLERLEVENDFIAIVALQMEEQDHETRNVGML